MTTSPVDGRLAAVEGLARTCELDPGHPRQVTWLALRLFDELQMLHGLGPREREWLHFAALLHDIGWVEGWKEHHKTSLRIILETPLLPFDNKERLLVGSVARYHRKALPDLKHDHYSALDEGERLIVDKLAGILRLADGLDSSHQNLVEELTCQVTPKKVTVHCVPRSKPGEEVQTAVEKSDLLIKTFGRRVEIKWADEVGSKAGPA